MAKNKKKKARARAQDQVPNNPNSSNTGNGKDKDGDINVDNPKVGFDRFEDLNDEFKTLSDNEPPIRCKRRHKNPDVGDWVKDTIRESTEKVGNGNEIMEDIFLSDDPNFEELENFFKELNDHIRSANVAHKVDLNRGVIPDRMYRAMYDPWRSEILKIKGDEKIENKKRDGKRMVRSTEPWTSSTVHIIYPTSGTYLLPPQNAYLEVDQHQWRKLPIQILQSTTLRSLIRRNLKTIILLGSMP